MHLVNPTSAAGKFLKTCLEKFGPNGERWIKGAEKRVDHGVEKFCSLGVIRHTVGEGRVGAETMLRSVLKAKDGSPDVVYLNDRKETTFDLVKSRFLSAIKLADKAESLKAEMAAEEAATAATLDIKQAEINELYKAQYDLMRKREEALVSAAKEV